jgi:hypothetical protein
MRSAALALIIAILALALAGCGSKCGDLPGTVAKVNDEAISCTNYVNQLNARAGRQVLSNMIEKSIIMQWAKEAGVPPTDAQVDKQIALMKSEGQYDDQAKVLGEDVLRSELVMAQARLNLAKKYVKISDKEIQQIYDRMKPSRFVHGPRKFVALIVNSDKTKLEAALSQIKSGKSFDQVAEKYSDRAATPYPPLKMWVGDGTLPALASAVKDKSKGETTDVVSLPQQGTNVIMKVLDTQGAVNKKLDQVRDDVIDTIAIQKSQFDPDFVKKLNEKKKAARIQIDIPRYKDVSDEFKNPQQAMPMMPGPGAG